MILRSGQVTDEYARPVPGATIYVYNNTTGAEASLTSDGTTPLAQPVTTDEFGVYTYYATEDYYREDTYFAGKLRFKEIVAIGDPGADLSLRTDLALSSGSGLLGWISSLASVAARTVQDKLRDFVSLLDFTNHAAAVASGKVVYVPADYTSPLALSGITNPHWGPGQITTSDGLKHGRFLTRVAAAPASRGDQNNIDTAFSGDHSKHFLVLEHRIEGATLGSPTTGYMFTPEAAALQAYVLNTSGHNEGTADDTGRTSGNFGYVKLDNRGQGDLAGLTFMSFVNGARAGATSFLANPAVTMVNGTMTAGAHAVYLNPFEVDLQLGAYDAAAIGHVTKITRNTGDTGSGLNAFTAGYRVQSLGSYPIDAGLSLLGPIKVGVDGTLASFPNKAWGALKSGDRLYFNASSSDGLKATSLGTDYVERSASGLDLYFNGTLSLRVGDTGLQVNLPALRNFANDAAAAAATPAVPVSGLYRNGSVMMVRVA